MLNRRDGVKAGLLLAIVALCLFEFVLRRQSSVFREYETALFQMQSVLLLFLCTWSGLFIFSSFNLIDWTLIILLFSAIVRYLIKEEAISQESGIIALLAGVTLGKGAVVLLNVDCKSRFLKRESTSKCERFEIRKPRAVIQTFLVGLVVLLAVVSWWSQDMSDNFYHGPRWMGLWNNPNDYGLLMGTGLTLAVGLLAANRKSVVSSQQRVVRTWKPLLHPIFSFATNNTVGDLRSLSLKIILLVAAGMMGVGLMFSYSRGAWLGTGIGLLYLVKAYEKLRWRWILPGILVMTAVIWFFWNNTPDTGPWYVKRLDLGRPSAQHRVVAWKAGLDIMRDHPLGVGWDKTVAIYEGHYSPPEDGAGAITTNDYLMLGTQLGWPGLICFCMYSWLSLTSPKFTVHRPQSKKTRDCGLETWDWLKAVCRAGAIVLAVGFWFDGGLFKLPTAATFWILLELGNMAAENAKNARSEIQDVATGIISLGA
jgi:hypothetical protein